MKNILKIFILILFSMNAFGLSLNRNTVVKLTNEEFKKVENLKFMDEVCVLDKNGDEQTVKIEHIYVGDKSVTIQILNYDNIVATENWAFEENRKASLLNKTTITQMNPRLKVTKKALFTAVMFSLFQVVESGPVAAALCPGICPVMLTVGCHPIGQSVIIATIGTLTAGLGATWAGPAVISLCTAGLAASSSGCVSACTVTLAVPFFP